MGFPRHELEQVAIFFSRGSSQPRDWIYIFCTGRRIFYHWVTRLRFVTASLLISWLQSLSAVILEPKKIWSVTASIFSTSICHEVMGLDAMILVSLMLSFKPGFALSSYTLIKKPFSCFSLYTIRVVIFVYLRLLIFLPAILIPACVSSILALCMMYSA